MSKLKKVLLMCTAYILVATLAVGGTLAYLTSEDSDVNVMTLGNVKIEQVEQERDANGALTEFTQDKPAFPAVYDTEAWAADRVQVNGGAYKVFSEEMKNVVDKIVTVNNIGKSDAFVRTLVAIEAPDGDPEDLIHLNYNGTDTTNKGFVVIEIDGVDYCVFNFTYNEMVAAGEKSAPSLMQLFLDKKADNADCAKFGDTWEVLVLSQAVQVKGFDDASTALDTAFGVFDATNAAKWFGGVLAGTTDTWDGTESYTWLTEDPEADEFTLKSAEDLAGFAAYVEGRAAVTFDASVNLPDVTFDGKTVKLGKNIDLYAEDENGDVICFDPIGSYRNEVAFKGTFDGQGFTISNLSQNTWALDNGYYYSDLGLGLFGLLEDATVKNLTIDNANISGESAICGTVAACAYGDCTFENITVKNSKVNDYQYYAGGIVGWASGNHTYKNINMDASTIIGSQWGDFGNANGGIIGGIGKSGTYHFEDCTVACRIDATNDVVSAYQWYNYRNSGMLVGRVPQTATNGEVQTVATPNNVTCENVTVIYGNWANYTYCEFAGTGYPYVRVQAGVSVDAYSNVRYGHPSDANGNTVVDDTHVHNAGEAHHELIAFDQLFGGPADHRYCYYGISAYPGVTVVYNNK